MAQKLLIERDGDPDVTIRFSQPDDDNEVYVELNLKEGIYITKQDAEAIIKFLQEQFKL